MSRTLLVGFGGSSASRWALEWAATEAVRREARLEVVAVADHASLAGCPPTQLLRRWKGLNARADALAADAARLVTAAAPGLDVEVHAEVGAPAAALVTASHRGSALVLGTGGRPGRGARRRDLVVEAVAAHARCPVVVVKRGHAVHPGPTAAVVAGVDGSSRSDRALDVAAAVAHVSGAPLHVACIWRPRASASLRAGTGRFGPATAVIPDEAIARHVAESGAARARQAYPDVRTTAIVHVGSAPAVLLRLARAGGVLVLGRRGRGERASLLLGSVSRNALRKLPCPVILVGLAGSPPEQFPTPVTRLADLSLPG